MTETSGRQGSWQRGQRGPGWEPGGSNGCWFCGGAWEGGEWRGDNREGQSVGFVLYLREPQGMAGPGLWS